MMEGLRKDAGTFRTKNAGVYDGDRLIHAGTPASYVPEVMADLFEWLGSTKLHPLLASCVFHYEFEFIHPFSDGNGRIGRLWHTLLLARWRSVLRLAADRKHDPGAPRRVLRRIERIERDRILDRLRSLHALGHPRCDGAFLHGRASRGRAEE